MRRITSWIWNLLFLSSTLFWATQAFSAESQPFNRSPSSIHSSVSNRTSGSNSAHPSVHLGIDAAPWTSSLLQSVSTAPLKPQKTQKGGDHLFEAPRSMLRNLAY